MAEGQIKKDVIKKARKNPVKPAKTSGVEESDDPYSQASIDAGSLEGKVSPAPAIREDRGDQSAFEEKSTMRQDFFNEMKKKSRLGELTPEMYAKAKEQLGKYEGVSGEAFESAMKKNSIRPSNFATAAPTESKEEAAQNVMFQRQYGTGLGTLAAMQDSNYELGSGSALRQPARSIGPASGKFRRAARRLRRQGYGGAAQQMAMAGEMARMNEPSIDTPALRGQRMLQKMATAKEARKQDKIAAGSGDMFDAMGMEKPTSNDSIQTPMTPAKAGVVKGARKRVSAVDKANSDFEDRRKKREADRIKLLPHFTKDGDDKMTLETLPHITKDGDEMILSPYQTAEFRDFNGNGIEDRSEGIYRDSDYIRKPKNWGKNIAL